MASKMRYSKLPHVSEWDEYSKEQFEKLTAPKRHKYRSLVIYGAAEILVLLLSSIVSFYYGRSTVSLEQCGRRLSTYSPALGAIEYREEMYSGKFLAPSIYRGVPADVDGSWDRLVKNGTGSIRVPKEDIWKLNKTPSESLLGFPHDDSGDAQTVLEVFHQLHCLNELRKKTWPGYYPAIAPDKEKVDRAHIDHCIEILRINLMCVADVTPITADWVDWKDMPEPDFSTKHTCRNFDKIFDYVTEHAEAYGVWA